MDEIPADLLASLPPGSEQVVQTWWQGLSADERARIADLWDERREVHFFIPQEDATGCFDSWENLPRVQGGKFVPRDQNERAEWGPGYFEHLLAHPELVLGYDPTARTFHIGCTAHPAAQNCLAGGRVPADFSCPLASDSCPLVPLRGASFARPAMH